MISALQKRSYQTAAFHGNEGEFFNRNVAFPKMGFKKFYDIRSMKLEHKGWGAPDNQVVAFVENHLKKAQEPFIYYFITMSSHEPFTAAKMYYVDNEYKDIEDETVRNYFNSMSYVDQSIMHMVRYVQSSFKNTYILIYGDHAPNIESAAYRDASFKIGDRLFEFVPLFILTPDNRRYVETKKVASMLDIAPSVLQESGVEFKIKSDGENLMSFGKLTSKIPFKSGMFDRSNLSNILKKKFGTAKY
jgi:phosphoglycerol transferase MdoB-like AlkP superfamily enzyme